MPNKAKEIQEIGRFMTVAITAILFGSTMILSAVGPARANEGSSTGNHPNPVAMHYLA